MVKRRNGRLYLYFQPFLTKTQVGVRVDVPTVSEAREVETLIKRACRSGNYAILDNEARETAIRLFKNQEWQVPEEFGGEQRNSPVTELTLWDAFQRFLKSPEVRDSKQRWRHEVSLLNIAEKLGKKRPVKDLWVTDLRSYRETRIKEGRKPTTINRELSSLSRVFTFLVEERVVDDNPVRRLPKLSEKCSLRQAQISKADVERIAGACPDWYAEMIWVSFHTGMRRGEVMNLTWKEVSLNRRMIYLLPGKTKTEPTKEGRIKRVPLRREVVPIFERAMRIPCRTLGDHVFVIWDSKGVRPVNEEAAKNPFGRACEKLGLAKPWPRFQDLRATWKTNARRSRMHPEIEKAIMGHGERGLSVHERYGFISDEELVQAIDKMTFDNVQETRVLTADGLGLALSEKPEQNLNKSQPAKRKARVNLA